MTLRILPLLLLWLGQVRPGVAWKLSGPSFQFALTNAPRGQTFSSLEDESIACVISDRTTSDNSLRWATISVRSSYNYYHSIYFRMFDVETGDVFLDNAFAQYNTYSLFVDCAGSHFVSSHGAVYLVFSVSTYGYYLSRYVLKFDALTGQTFWTSSELGMAQPRMAILNSTHALVHDVAAASAKFLFTKSGYTISVGFSLVLPILAGKAVGNTLVLCHKDGAYTLLAIDTMSVVKSNPAVWSGWYTAAGDCAVQGLQLHYWDSNGFSSISSLTDEVPQISSLVPAEIAAIGSVNGCNTLPTYVQGQIGCAATNVTGHLIFITMSIPKQEIASVIETAVEVSVSFTLTSFWFIPPAIGIDAGYAARLCPHAAATFSNVTRECSACTGTWLPSPSQLGCYPCAAGYEVSGSYCVACSGSKAGGGPWDVCRPCDVLQGLVPSADRSTCEQCPDGYVVDPRTNATCAPCPVGSFQSGTRCLLCPRGKACPFGSGQPQTMQEYVKYFTKFGDVEDFGETSLTEAIRMAKNESGHSIAFGLIISLCLLAFVVFSCYLCHLHRTSPSKWSKAKMKLATWDLLAPLYLQTDLVWIPAERRRNAVGGFAWLTLLGCASMIITLCISDYTTNNVSIAKTLQAVPVDIAFNNISAAVRVLYSSYGIITSSSSFPMQQTATAKEANWRLHSTVGQLLGDSSNLVGYLELQSSGAAATICPHQLEWTLQSGASGPMASRSRRWMLNSGGAEFVLPTAYVYPAVLMDQRDQSVVVGVDIVQGLPSLSDGDYGSGCSSNIQITFMASFSHLQANVYTISTRQSFAMIFAQMVAVTTCVAGSLLGVASCYIRGAEETRQGKTSWRTRMINCISGVHQFLMSSCQRPRAPASSENTTVASQHVPGAQKMEAPLDGRVMATILEHPGTNNTIRAKSNMHAFMPKPTASTGVNMFHNPLSPTHASA